MLTKNLTPFSGAMKVTSTAPPQLSMSVAVRATYAIGDDGALTLIKDPLGQRPLSSGVYREGDDERAGGCLGPDDLADFKPKAEVLVKATCHAPKGVAVTECPVMVKVGDWSKTLRVTGRRTHGAQPIAFTKLPIDWEHAYGGSGFDKNPVGRGFSGDEMPCVTYAKDVAPARGDTGIEPASFAPVNPRWPQRSKKIGQAYDAAQMRTAPYFGADFNWEYFMDGPADQWLPRLRGSEVATFQNLHPRIPILTLTLPSVIARVFYRDDRQTFREIPMVLDTLFADLDAGVLELTWRGLGEVREDDLSDVKSLLIASEPMGEKQPVSHYEALLTRFEENPLGLPKELANPLEAPPLSPSGELPRLKSILSDSLGDVLPSEAADALDFMDAAVASAADRPEVKKAIAEQAGRAAEAPPPRVKKPGALPYFGLRRAVRSQIEQGKKARDEALAKGLKREHLGQLAEIEKLAEDPRWLELDPSYTPPEPLSTCAPGPGADLRDRDLRGLDLRGADLQGANLEGAILTGVDLEGANLGGARLYGTVFYKARLRGAKLEGADLSRAHLGFADATNAIFDGATLAETCLESANLENASLIGAKGEYAIFSKSRLVGAKLERAELRNAEMDEVDATRAVFKQASLDKAHFGRARARGADFSRAKLNGASFAGAELVEARFFDARVEGSVFENAVADRAIFAFARLGRALMTRLAADNADFHAADLRHARLKRASCKRAAFTQANLFSADLTQSKLDGATFKKASLYDAKLAKASVVDCDFSSANLKRVVREPS
ncbi:MAG: DUF2169 domain-containing protein [Polyangiaceae bacterium]